MLTDLYRLWNESNINNSNRKTRKDPMQSPIQKVFSPYSPPFKSNLQLLENRNFLLQNSFQMTYDQEPTPKQCQLPQPQECPRKSSTVKQQNLTISVRVLLVLTEQNLIIMKEAENQGFIPWFFTELDFDLKFQVIRKKWTDQMTPGEATGLKIERSNVTQRIEFSNPNPNIIEMWRKTLEKKINQRNFHKLFKAKKKIGKGAFASVYLAERLLDGKMVAVKAFSKEKQFSTKNGKEALINEIKILRELDHPNLTSLQGIYETENSLYMTLEILNGGQLHQRLKTGNPFTEQESRHIIKCLLNSLSHLSQKRIIHRDLKPENIMFKTTDSLEIALCDFGLATHADEKQYLFVRCGTPGFVAPEIINIKDMATKSQSISDVFSAGVIFHFLLIGHSIFPGKKYNDVLVQNRACDFDFSLEGYSKLPSRALELLKKMLEVNPTNRPSAEQCLNHPFFTDAMEIQNENELKIVENQEMIDQTPNTMKSNSMVSESTQNSAFQVYKQSVNSFNTPQLARKTVSQKPIIDGQTLLPFSTWKKQNSFCRKGQKENSGQANSNNKENIILNQNRGSIFSEKVGERLGNS